MKVRHLIVAGVVAAVAVPAGAIGAGEGRPVDGGTRNPSTNPRLDYTRETEIIADTRTYGTRQSNKRDGDGGGAVYGCRSNPGNEPCVRAVNLKGGRAFEFESVGSEGGRIEVADPNGAPLTTNATGVATNLNADRLDGREATDFSGAGDLKFARVGVDGALQGGRGATGARLRVGNDNTFEVSFDRDVSGCSFTVTATGTATPGVVFATAPGETPQTVIVDQQNDGGSSGGIETARPFHLQVVC